MPIDFGDGSGLLIVVAHPDDEAIGLGGQLSRWPGAHLTTVTDGSPLDLGDAQRAGCRNRTSYAALRKREQSEALRIAGLPQSQCTWMNVIDQHASRNLVNITLRIADQIDRLKVLNVITHPFEGGHPDHDAVAFAVHAAVQLVTKQRPCIFEFASYHAGDEGMCVQKFRQGSEASEVTLDHQERAIKRRMFEAHGSQAPVLAAFSPDVERLRLAPEYDFHHAPQDCWYERCEWGLTPRQWEAMARQAWAELSEVRLLCP